MRTCACHSKANLQRRADVLSVLLTSLAAFSAHSFCPQVHIEAVILPAMVQGEGDGGIHHGEGRGAFVKVSNCQWAKTNGLMLKKLAGCGQKMTALSTLSWHLHGSIHDLEYDNPSSCRVSSCLIT